MATHYSSAYYFLPLLLSLGNMLFHGRILISLTLSGNAVIDWLAPINCWLPVDEKASGYSKSPDAMQSFSYAVSQSSVLHSKCIADLLKAWTSKIQANTQQACRKFILSGCFCCQGYSIEVCSLFIRSRLPGRHRAADRLACWYLPPVIHWYHRYTESESDVKSLWCACVNCITQPCLSFMVCVTEYKNSTHAVLPNMYNFAAYYVMNMRHKDYHEHVSLKRKPQKSQNVFHILYCYHPAGLLSLLTTKQ